MVLYFIGLGLSDEKDISLKGLEIVRKCSKIFLENYTSKLLVDKSRLEKLYGKKITLADRELVEKKSDTILIPAKNSDIAFLVIGDILSATTHMDLWLRAKKSDIKTHLIHNASILTAVAVTGLQLYKFGKTTSIPFPDGDWKPETPYDVIKQNKKNGLHTLVLLDLVPDKEFMIINTAIKYLLDIEAKRKEKVFTKETLAIGCARLGSDKKTIICANAGELIEQDFGKPLHSLIVPGDLHFVEEEVLSVWKK